MPGEPPAPARRHHLAKSAAFFSIATGLSRVAGLVREMVAKSYYAVGPAAGAFTIAFNVPNLVRALFADAALQAAFVPVFTELLEKGERREAFRVAGSLFYLILLVLGLITGVFILAAPLVMPLFAPGADPTQTDLIVVLSRILFPIVLLLGLTGLFVGILNSFDHFEVPAISPLFWNVAIIAAIVGLVPVFPAEEDIYAYAIGVVLGTIVQMLMPLPLVLKRTAGEGMWRRFEWRNPHVLRVLALMVPVTIGLGLINFNLAINNYFASYISDGAPAVIDAAFRIYMLPQGMFSVAIATVLFPTLARFAARADIDGLRHTMGNGVRQMFMLLLPAAVFSAVLAEPIVRLLYQRGNFTADDTVTVAEALFWFSFSLPFSGISLLYTRTFFAIKRPWLTTGLALVNLIVNVSLAALLYEPYGVSGIVVATVAATIAMALAQAVVLRTRLHRLETRETLWAVARIALASAALAAVSYVVWWAFDEQLGRGVPAQIVSLSAAFAAGVAVFAAAVSAMQVREAEQIRALIAGRFRRGR
jgi:putative peptidoglycan lipid II flippase